MLFKNGKELKTLLVSILLHHLQKENNIAYNAEDVKFFEHQLDLFGKLAYVSIYFD